MTAAIVAIVLVAGGYALVWPAGTLARIAAVGLVAAIVSYNAGAKRIPVAGPINMGMCRGLSLLLGAAPMCEMGLKPPAVLAGAGLLTGYIAVVTFLAKAETHPSSLPVLRRLNPNVIPQTIGTLIRLLLVYQAAVAATAGPVGWAVAACLLAAWYVSTLLARRFYAS
jgi:4-hydroxybenzoate polyprenyltransferase